MSKEFFATVQNKLHFAIHGHTAAEAFFSATITLRETAVAIKRAFSSNATGFIQKFL